MNVLPVKSNIFNLQKFCVSDNSQFGSSNGKYALIRDSDNMLYLCQIFICKMLHQSCCNIDRSVCCYNYESNHILIYPPQKTFNSVKFSDINVINSVESIRTVILSVILKTSLDIKHWKSAGNRLCDLVKNILKLFVLRRHSVVFLDGVKSLFETDIECILIESIGNANVGRIVSSSKVKIKEMISKETFVQLYTAGEKLPVLGGLDHYLKILSDLVKLASSKIEQPVFKQVLILGPSGCGKTAMVRQVARDCGLVLKEVVGPELSSPLPGEAEQALTKIFEECRLLAEECSAGCVLLLDQVDTICGRRDTSSEGHLVRLSNQLFSLLETVNSTPGLIVVGTSSRPQLLDPAVRRPGRFDHEIHISVSSEGERASIVSAVTRQLGMSESVSRQVAQWTPGFVGADLALLAANVARHIEKQGLKICHDVEADILPCWQACVGQLRPSCLRGQLGVVAPILGTESSLADLGGVDKIKRSLLQAIQWPLVHADAFMRMGLPQPKGVLLYGPPGCAKTSLVRAIASATNTTFLAVSAAEIYSPYVGEAEQSISELFHRARIGAPSILFIDEIDALVGCRGKREKGSQERILTSFLTEMDGIGVRLDSGTAVAGVVVVAATNRPDVLDPALTRPGRFDRIVYVGPPEMHQRLEILQTLTRKMPLAEDVDLKLLAQQTELFSGADLAQLCKEAGLQALTLDGMSVTEITQRHWLSSLEEMTPSLTKDQVEKYRRMEISS